MDERKARIRAVTASELAQMGVCERMVCYDHRYGKRHSPQAAKSLATGTLLHKEFYAESRAAIGQQQKMWDGRLGGASPPHFVGDGARPDQIGGFPAPPPASTSAGGGWIMRMVARMNRLLRAIVRVAALVIGRGR